MTNLLKPLVVALAFGIASVAYAQTASHWVGSWGAPPCLPHGPDLANQTIRQTLRLSVGGHAVRIRISNELGTQPLVIGSATFAKPTEPTGAISPKSLQKLTFGGRTNVTILPGSPALSDPITVDTAALDSVTISLFITRATGPAPSHLTGIATTLLCPGDHTADTALPNPTKETQRFFLSEVEVDSPNASTVVTLGDSITDGACSTVDANNRWPDLLAERLARENIHLGIVNAGISGNRVLHDVPENRFGPAALSRFDRDVLSVPGVKTVILLEGINDIGHPTGAALPDQKASADDIIAGYQQLIDRAHAHGLRMVGCTLTPFADTVFPGYFSPEGESIRTAVNTWTRTPGHFDAVIDFDKIVQDPARPDHIAAEFDSGDHLHPNDKGYKRMGEAIDLKLLTPPE